MCDIDTCDKSETATTREQILGVAKTMWVQRRICGYLIRRS